MINPTLGRVVWFYPSNATASSDFSPPPAGQPLAAIIVAVLAADLINLVVFDAVGNAHSRTSVPLIQEDQTAPDDGYYANWMPYQIGQAKKAEAIEKDAAAIGGSAPDNRYLRAQAIEMALRTPGLTGHAEVLAAATAYMAHIDGDQITTASS